MVFGDGVADIAIVLDDVVGVVIPDTVVISVFVVVPLVCRKIYENG